MIFSVGSDYGVLNGIARKPVFFRAVYNQGVHKDGTIGQFENRGN